MLATLRKIGANFHYVCTVLLAIFAVPLVEYLHLPTHLDLRGNIVFYWFALGSRSLLYAMAFCLMAFPLSQTLGPFVARYRQHKLRMTVALVFLMLLCILLSPKTAIASAVKTLFVVELAERSKLAGISLFRKAMGVFVPAVYMFVGLTLVIIYNDIIVADRFPLSYDAMLRRADAILLLGHSVSSIAHSLWTILPARWLAFLDFAYFQMFAIVGAGLLTSAYVSCKRGMRFAGACLTAYFLALLVFYFWPTYGPYVFCRTHAAQCPPSLTACSFQTSGMRSLQAVSQGKTRYLGSGYYIAFPALHVGLPLITMGMMRRWRPVFWVLAVYNCIVVFAIVTLEWHYAVDLSRGAAVGLLALVLVGELPPGRRESPGRPSLPEPRDSTESTAPPARERNTLKS